MENNKIVEYLQNREKALYDFMNSLTEGTEMYKETRAKHIELLHILKELQIELTKFSLNSDKYEYLENGEDGYEWK